MRVLHLVPGLNAQGNGIAVAAKLIAAGQRSGSEVEVKDTQEFSAGRDLRGVDEIWVHSMWLPRTMLACWSVLNCGAPKLVRMMHANLDPVRLAYHGWKKQLVGPIERRLLRRSDRIVATCEAEKGWIKAYVGKGCPEIVVEDLKRFFDLNREEGLCRRSRSTAEDSLHVLYLGRRHPLKGVEFLERAVRELVEVGSRTVELRIVSDHFGEELEKDWKWCDVLVLPTLSENFGLVVAEALERGKKVITTDGAPAWEPPEAAEVKVRGEGEQWRDRIIYLKGFRDGTDEERVRLLKDAIRSLVFMLRAT